MNCKKCEKNPIFHSFEFASRLSTGEGVYYTCPSKGVQREMKEDSIIDYVAHMDGASIGSWIWIIECSGLEAFHLPSLSVLQKFMTVIQERYKFVLRKVYIVNTNWKMNIILNITKPFIQNDMKNKLVIVQSTLHLLSYGFDTKTLSIFNK